MPAPSHAFALPAADAPQPRAGGRLRPTILGLAVGLCCVFVGMAFNHAAFPTFEGLPSFDALPFFNEARPVLRPGFSSFPPTPAAPRLLLDIGWLPGIELRTALVALHLIGLCFGLGGATMLDFWILRWLRWRALPDTIVRTFEFLAKVVSVGLVLLWLSGIGFLVTYALDSPEKLSNPKVWAKVTMVLALTVNGLLLHATVIPQVLANPQRPLLMDLSFGQRAMFILCGAVSGVSWYAAFALGLLREFNNKVPAGTLLGLWLAAIGVVAALTALACWMAMPRADAMAASPRAQGA